MSSILLDGPPHLGGSGLMPVLMLSGFEAWGDHHENPSGALVEMARPRLPAQWRLKKLVLPVCWKRAVPTLLEALDDQTGAVVCFGLAARRTAITPERYARNRANPLARDGYDHLPEGPVLVTDGPVVLETTLPVDEIVAGLRAEGYPVEVSEDAGDYLCNALSFHLLLHLRERAQWIPAGFVHLPPPLHLHPGEHDKVLATILRYAIALSS